MIKKFYDMDANDVATSAPTESIASIMAREGVKSNSEGADIQPVRLNTNGSWESEAPAAPAKAEDSVQDSLTSNQSEAQVPEHQEDEEQQSYDWEDTIKSQQPEDVLKALGYDDKTISFIRELKDVDPKMVGFLNNWKEGGNVTDYLNELSKDFSSMPPEDVMRHQLRIDYPKATEAQLEVLYKKEIVEKYNLNSYDEDEISEGKLLLEAKAEKYRDELVKAQQDRLIPAAPDKTAEMQAEQQMIAEFSQGIVKEFNENPYTKEVIAKNAITIGEGSDKFSFPIDSKAITDLVINGDTTGELMFEKVNKNGQETYVPKTQHQLLVATVNKYGEKFITELAKHYKSLGSKAAIEPIDNARPTESRSASSNSSAEPTTLAGAMAKYGRLNSGG
jgi:hypothetical protein